MEVSIQEEIKQIKMGRPHIVILGAGASCAAFPNGDKYGLQLPVMNNFFKVLQLDNILSKINKEIQINNFEDIYSYILKYKKYNKIRIELEKRVYNYFQQMNINDFPTIYDHLILSLRDKDIIATFNWDPLLIQAYKRNSIKFSSLPRLLFLHGNVAIGYCNNDNVIGVNGNNCRYCGKELIPTKLLYPIKKKNYNSNRFISLQWKELRNYIRNAFMITIFGYSAPKSDTNAISLMKSAWSDSDFKEFIQTEIIDVKKEDILHETWYPFLYSHHYDIYNDFYKSWIANHPRRTGEAYINQYIDAAFIEDNPIPRNYSFKDLWNWYIPFIENEKSR